MSCHARVELASMIVRTARVAQLEGLFDVAPAARSVTVVDVALPLDEREWRIGLIVGPSGSGKSTTLAEAFGRPSELRWSDDRAVVDDFPAGMPIRDITSLLSSVGFSSPPAWLRPYRHLSTGEQFRVSVARRLAEAKDVIAIDEFTSVVDRPVAQIGSAAVAAAIRRTSLRLVVATCHYDVETWLDPDWVYEPHLSRFQWRELQGRPAIAVTIRRTRRDLWPMFRRHHYLSGDLNHTSRCFMATVRGEPAAFAAVLPLIGYKNCWREHRMVCLPDFQGVGLGSAVSRTVAGLVVAATGGRYRSSSSHPAFVASRSRSSAWRLVSAPKFQSTHSGSQRSDGGSRRISGKTITHPQLRFVATHEYVGPLGNQEVASEMWRERLVTENR